ncbi:MAG: XdhC family protein [Actinobacteria bacterium]|nr:XdhC family protein [Actinomycetota bacterium]
MREIVDDVLAELATGRPFAFVTLITERGSTPRSVGAQMLVRADGSIAGTIGGGLLEATMMRRAADSISEARSQVSGLQLAGRSVADQEMLCGGSAEVLIACVPGADAALRAVCEGVADAVADARQGWCFTFFTPGEEDVDVTYCLLLEDGRTVGEAPVPAEELRRLIGKVGVHGTTTLPDGRSVHAETIGLPTRAIICGAGHVALALAPIAAHAGFAPVVLDDRPQFAHPGRFPGARVIALPDFNDAFAGVAVDDHSYVVIVTRGHQHDFSVLAQSLRTPAAYIGLMSSRSKWKKIDAGLRELGFGDADIARIHSPVGLAIGAETPAELAVSIVAEMIQVRAGGA